VCAYACVCCVHLMCVYVLHVSVQMYTSVCVPVCLICTCTSVCRVLHTLESYDSLATLVTAETRTVVCAYLDLYVLVCMFMLSFLMSHMYVLVYVGSSDPDTAETRMGICVHVCVYARGCICLCSHVACLYGVVHVYVITYLCVCMCVCMRM